jgi:2-polyprenyl-3-methyl-5-hydroxy-6-metoxy-1,4-benzoquinol methylase
MSPNSAYYGDNYRRFLPQDFDAPIVDLGCGQGDFVRYLSELGYRNVTAVDHDGPAIAALDGMPGVRATAAAATAETIEQNSGGWALIIAKQMIYYFDRRDAPSFVAGLAQALAPDGRLVVEVFNGALLSSRFTELKDPGILTAYTENGLKRLLEQNGFRVEELFGATSRRNGLKGALYSAARKFWFRLYRLLLILERGMDDELPRISSKSIIAVARRSRR